MKKMVLVAVAAMLAGCMSSGGKFVDAVPNGVEVAAKPVTFFLQGVQGSSPPSIQSAQFIMQCDPQAPGSLQQRADASAAYSELARERVSYFLVNAMVRRGWMREVQAQSVPNQQCAVKDLRITRVTNDQGEVIRFVMENNLLPRIAELPR